MKIQLSSRWNETKECQLSGKRQPLRLKKLLLEGGRRHASAYIDHNSLFDLPTPKPLRGRRQIRQASRRVFARFRDTLRIQNLNYLRNYLWQDLMTEQ